MNRGSSAAPFEGAAELSASMRPRFMNRGSHNCESENRRGSRGFNEAPIHESGKWCLIPAALSPCGSLQ